TSTPPATSPNSRSNKAGSPPNKPMPSPRQSHITPEPRSHHNPSIRSYAGYYSRAPPPAISETSSAAASATQAPSPPTSSGGRPRRSSATTSPPTSPTPSTST